MTIAWSPEAEGKPQHCGVPVDDSFGSRYPRLGHAI
jgi:hypothetical protein